MLIALTGGDGFIGSHMTRLLLQAGHEVRLIQRKPSSKASRVGDILDSVEWIQGDCGDSDFCEIAFSGVEVVYHFASSTNQAITWSDPAREVREGLLRSVSCMEGAAHAGVKKFALASSGGTVYGRAQGMLIENSHPKPFTPYGISKLAIELFAHSITERTGMLVDVYRISNPYGPFQFGDDKQGVIAIWLKRILQGKKVHVYGDHEAKRDYIFVEDVCNLIAYSIKHVGFFGTFNVCSGRAISTLELLSKVQDSLPIPFESEVGPRRDFDNLSTELSNSRILEHFKGYQFVSLEKGLERTWDWQSTYFTKER